MEEMEAIQPLLDYNVRPPGWVVVESTELGLVIRDPDISLIDAILAGWRLLLTAALNATLAAFCFLIAPPLLIFQFIGGVAAIMIVLCFHCIWQRWRSPSLVRLGHGQILVRNRRGSKLSENEWDVREVIDVETSHNSSTFHSQYSIRIHLRDGSRVPFLHCMNGNEGHWLHNYLKMLIANEQEALAVQEGLVSLEVSLPPPPLPALVARVRGREEQVIGTAPTAAIKTAQPGLPDSQSGSISNRNRA